MRIKIEDCQVGDFLLHERQTSSEWGWEVVGNDSGVKVYKPIYDSAKLPKIYRPGHNPSWSQYVYAIRPSKFERALYGLPEN